MDGLDSPQPELHLRQNSPDFSLQSGPGPSRLRLCPSFASQLDPGWIAEDLQLSSEVQEAQSTEPGVHLRSQCAILFTQHNHEAV